MADNPRDLMKKLDEVIPPNGEGVHHETDDPLVEIAARLADIPRVSLSEPAIASIEAQLREAALTLGAPRPRFPRLGRRPILLLATAAMVFIAGLWAIWGGDQNQDNPSPAQMVTPTSTITLTPSSTVTPTPTFTPTVITTPSITVAPTLTPTALPVGTLVIEGPIESINGTVVIIYGISIHLDPTNPVTPTVQVGDTLHVEGEIEVVGEGIIVVAQVVIFVQVEVYINDMGEVFRDDAPCNNPPPPWAPAHGWRARCEGGQSPSDGMGDDD